MPQGKRKEGIEGKEEGDFLVFFAFVYWHLEGVLVVAKDDGKIAFFYVEADGEGEERIEAANNGRKMEDVSREYL